MKLCFPTYGTAGLEENVHPHFGKSATYTLYDTETGEVSCVDNSSTHMGGSVLPPEVVKAAGADAMMCSGCGSKAISLFDELGIVVYLNVVGTVSEAIEAYNGGNLVAANPMDGCQH